MYGNFYPQMPQNPYMQAVQPQKQEVIKVNGENGARAYQMPPNSSALLLDESGQLVWLVVSDGACYKSIGAYDITPHEEASAPDYSTLEQRIARLEETINAYTANSTNARTERNITTDSTAPKNCKPTQKYERPASTYESVSSGEQSRNG